MRLTCVAALLLALGAAGGARADTIVAEADAYVFTDWGAKVNYNYGAATALQYQITNDKKTYLSFDLSSLSRPVSDARLKLKNAGTDLNYGRTIKIFAIMDEASDWDLATLAEGAGTGSDTAATDITWANAPQNPSSGDGFLNEGTGYSALVRELATLDLSVTGTDIDLDVTDLINWALGYDAAWSQYAQSDSHLTILIRSNADVYGKSYSREYTPGDDSDAPRLEVTPAPEPATMLLLGLGGGALVAARRNRKR